MLIWAALRSPPGLGGRSWGIAEPHRVPRMAPNKLKLFKANVKGPSITRRGVDLCLDELAYGGEKKKQTRLLD